MRSHTILIFLTTLLLAGVALAWSPEDHELFRVRDELNTLEGKDTNFYEFLGVAPSASLDDINKQYKKRSRILHPDKAIPGMLAKLQMPSKKERVKPGPTARERTRVTKEANDRYAHLGVVTNILRSPQRKRYDHFYKNGFPLWRGTGYYYARFRPGLGSVLFGLFFVFGGVLHYGAMYVSWKRQQDFVNRYVTYARRMAYGNDAGVPGVPGVNGNIEPAQAATQPRPETPLAEEEQGMALNRRQKRMQEKDTKKKPDSKLATRAARLARIKGRDDSPSGSDSGAASQPTPVEPEAYGPQGTKKKIIAENGKVLIVDSNGDVFLQQKTAEGAMHDFLLDPDELPKPTFAQTAVVRLPIWVYNQTVGRVLAGSSATREPFLDQTGESAINVTMSTQDQQAAAIDAAMAPNANGEVKKRKARQERA